MDNEEINMFLGKMVECEEPTKYEWKTGKVIKLVADTTFEIKCSPNKWGTIIAWLDISKFQVINQDE